MYLAVRPSEEEREIPRRQQQTRRSIASSASDPNGFCSNALRGHSSSLSGWSVWPVMKTNGTSGCCASQEACPTLSRRVTSRQNPLAQPISQMAVGAPALGATQEPSTILRRLVIAPLLLDATLFHDRTAPFWQSRP